MYSKGKKIQQKNKKGLNKKTWFSVFDAVLQQRSTRGFRVWTQFLGVNKKTWFFRVYTRFCI
jgi:hypothetical protein